MSDKHEMRFGVDLVTFYHPAFWGCSDEAGIAEQAKSDPIGFWNKVLDAIVASGVTGVELTFRPFHWTGAVAAYGSTRGFVQALKSRGLSLASGYLTELANGVDIISAEGQAEMIAVAKRYSEFLAEAGAGVMPAGTPMRQNPGDTPVRFHDLDAAKPMADFMNRLGAATAENGVKLALHTESQTVFARPRDVDLMMLLTDPQYVGFCPDSAHIVMSGGDPIAIADRYSDRIVLTHWKDAIGAMPDDSPIDDRVFILHRPYFRAVGEGSIDWGAWSDRMFRRHASAWHILELDAAADPVGAIRDSLAFARKVLPKA